MSAVCGALAARGLLERRGSVAEQIQTRRENGGVVAVLYEGEGKRRDVIGNAAFVQAAMAPGGEHSGGFAPFGKRRPGQRGARSAVKRLSVIVRIQMIIHDVSCRFSVLIEGEIENRQERPRQTVHRLRSISGPSLSRLPS